MKSAVNTGALNEKSFRLEAFRDPDGTKFEQFAG